MEKSNPRLPKKSGTTHRTSHQEALGGCKHLCLRGSYPKKSKLLPQQIELSHPLLDPPSFCVQDGDSFCLCRTALTPWQALTSFPSLTGEQILYYWLFAVDRTKESVLVRRRTLLLLSKVLTHGLSCSWWYHSGLVSRHTPTIHTAFSFRNFLKLRFKSSNRWDWIRQKVHPSPFKGGDWGSKPCS